MNDSRSDEPLSSDAPLRKPPSKFPGAATSFIGGVPGTLIAMATALGGMFQAYQSYQESQATSRSVREGLG